MSNNSSNNNSQDVNNFDNSNSNNQSENFTYSDNISNNNNIKKKRYSSKYFLWGLTAFLTVVACILFSFVINNTSKIFELFSSINKVLTPIYSGIIIAYLFTPILNFIENKIIYPILNKTKAKITKKTKNVVRAISIFLTIIFALALIIGLIVIMVSQIVPSIGALISNIDVYASNLQNWATNTLSSNPALMNSIIEVSGSSSEQIETFLSEDLLKNILRFFPFIDETSGAVDWSALQVYWLAIIGSIGKFIKGVWNTILGLIISIYLMADKEKFCGRAKKLTYSIFNRNVSNGIIRDVNFVHQTFIGFIGGKIVDSVIVGILCFIGTSIMGTPYAALVSLFVGITNIIPYFGPIIGAIPSALLIFLVDPTKPLNMIFFLIFILVLQQVDGNIIGPKILGESTGLEGFWVIFAITIFGGFFGVIGMIIGVPLFAVIYAGLRAMAAKSLKKKHLYTDSEDYIDIYSIKENGDVITKDEILKEKENIKKDSKEMLITKGIKKIIKKIKSKSKK